MDQKWFIAFYAGFYSRNPLISLIRDKIVLQLQLITPGSVSITVCRKCSISSLDEATKTAVWEVYKFIHVNTVAPFGTFRTKIRKWKKIAL